MGIQTAGIHVFRLDQIAFGIGVALAAAAGALLAPEFFVHPKCGSIATMKGFEIIVIGGLGSIPGVLCAGLLLGLIESLGAVFLDPSFRDVYGFLFLLAILAIKPTGLFGERERVAYAEAEGTKRYRLAAENQAKLPVIRQLLAKHQGDRILIIGQYLRQLRRIAKMLDAPLITGRTPTNERQRLYGLFRAGEVKLLVVSRVSNLAIDLPDANVAIQVSGTFGFRQEEAQRLGRILRPKRDGSLAHFYSLITGGTREQEFAQKRQLYLTEQGYRYHILYGEELAGFRPAKFSVTNPSARNEGRSYGSGDNTP